MSGMLHVRCEKCLAPPEMRSFIHTATDGLLLVSCEQCGGNFLADYRPLRKLMPQLRAGLAEIAAKQSLN